MGEYESTGSVHNISAMKRVRPGRSAENIVAVSESVEEDPNVSGNADTDNKVRYRDILRHFFAYH